MVNSDISVDDQAKISINLQSLLGFGSTGSQYQLTENADQRLKEVADILNKIGEIAPPPSP